MQALILAAGVGKRLMPLTENQPKCMVEVNGISLIENTLNHLANRNIDEVVIVVGYLKNKIIEKFGSNYKNMKITYVENEIYDTTNNVYSFYLAKDYIHDDVIMLESDLFYNRNLIDTMFLRKDDCDILVSPFNKETMDGSVIVVDKENVAKKLVIKRDQDENFDYTDAFKTVNIYSFKKEFIINKLFPAIETYVKTQSLNSYYELVIGSLIYFGNDNIKVIKTDDKNWCEIDDIDDLKRAERTFKIGKNRNN